MHFCFYNFKKEIVFVIGATPFDACDDVNANRYDQMDVCIKVTISPKVFQIVSTAALHKSLNF